MRPVDIARRLGVSTTTLRKYEDWGLVPPVARSEAGYRLYGLEHMAYFTCVRDMLHGFTIKEIQVILGHVIAGEIDAAYWEVNRLEAALYREREIGVNMMETLLRRSVGGPVEQGLTIHEVSGRTGVPASAIRYWDRVGLLDAGRNPANNYRVFTSDHVRQVLTLYAVKHAVYAKYYRHSIAEMRREMESYDGADPEQAEALVEGFHQHLNRVCRGRMRAGAALYGLCRQVEAGVFTGWE